MSTKPADKTYVNPFRTCDENGRPVRYRFSSAESLRAVFRKAKQDDMPAADARSRLLKLYEGKLPWNPAKLKAAGLADKCNVNYLELKGYIDARAAAVNDLALDTADLIELRPNVVPGAGAAADDISRIVSEEFSAAVRAGMGLLPVLSTMVRECDLYGFGPAMWTDADSYAPQPLLRANVKLHEAAHALSHRNELIMVESVLPAEYVFRLFDTPDESAAVGWNMGALKKYVVDTFVYGDDTRTDSMDNNGTSAVESAVADARQRRVFETRQYEELRVIHAFAVEVESGKVSHYIIPAKEGFNEWLLLRPDVYDSMNQALVWLPASLTENKAAGLRGVASFVAPVCDINNRVRCELLDAVRTANKYHFSSGVGAPQGLTITEKGQYAFFPDGVDVMQMPNVAQNLQQSMAAVQMGATTVTVNAAGAPGGIGAPAALFRASDRKSKEEVLQERERGEKTEQGLFVSRALVFDLIFREVFRRFLKLALGGGGGDEVKAFVSRCEARGVDKGKLREIPEAYTVYTCRDLVAGGAAVKANMLGEVLTQFGGSLDEKGRLDAFHDYVRCRMGSLAAARYRPLVGRDTIPSDSASHATLENNDMMELSPVLAAPDQMHWSHVPIHSQILQHITQAVESGEVGDPERMLAILNLAAQHIQEHIRYGGRQLGMEEAARKAMEMLRSLRPVQKALTMMAATHDRVRRAEEERQQREMQDLQERAEGKDTEVKLREIDTKAALAMREQDLMHQVRMRESESRAQNDAFRARMRAETERIAASYRRVTQGLRATGAPETGGAALARPELL